MEPRWYDIPMEELRRATRGHIKAGSLRSLAEHIGLSPHALRRFVEGSVIPQDRVRWKIAEWYLRSRPERPRLRLL